MLYLFCYLVLSCSILISKIVYWLQLWSRCMFHIWHLYANFHMVGRVVMIFIYCRFRKNDYGFFGSWYYNIYSFLCVDDVWNYYGRIWSSQDNIKNRFRTSYWSLSTHSPNWKGIKWKINRKTDKLKSWTSSFGWGRWSFSIWNDMVMAKMAFLHVSRINVRRNANNKLDLSINNDRSANFKPFWLLGKNSNIMDNCLILSLDFGSSKNISK